MLYVLPYGQMSLWGVYDMFVNATVPSVVITAASIKAKPASQQASKQYPAGHDKKFMAMFIGFMDGWLFWYWWTKTIQ